MHQSIYHGLWILVFNRNEICHFVERKSSRGRIRARGMLERQEQKHDGKNKRFVVGTIKSRCTSRMLHQVDSLPTRSARELRITLFSRR